MRYLVAIDSSENAERAFKCALDLINRNNVSANNELFLAHVVEINEPSIFDPFHDRIDFLVNIELKEKAKLTKEKYETLCAQNNIKHTYVESSGDARVQLCKLVQDLKIDNLVIGARGMGILKKILLGSVSSYCKCCLNV